MTGRNAYQPGVPCWVDTGQPDPRAAADFYGGLFGWEFSGPGPMPGDPPGEYFVARIRGSDVAGVGTTRPAGAPATWNTYIKVASADESVRSVEGAGGTILSKPFDVHPAGRMAVVTDTVGAVFVIWEARQREGAQLVNAPGAWAMSILNARDPGAAVAFYRKVFGWDTETFGDGDDELTLWRLPGYVGGKPEQPVPRDVVAVLVPTTDDPSNWSVNFWVDDADATAAKAKELGGTVLVPPFDTPVSRDAVIADPQGAVFSVSTAPGPPGS